MNTDFDTNFETALNLVEQNYTHKELLNFLQSGSVVQKQFAALVLDSVNTLEEANILIKNLTGCDGKIREAVALKINTILKNNPEKVELFIFPEIFANALIDINPNVCRLVADTVSILISDKEFSSVYLKKILEFTNNALDELDKFIFRDKKYVINKQLFKLYWCLESLKLFVNDIPREALINILERICSQKEYTIREKAAEILVNLDSSVFDEYRKMLKMDENYYVRRVLNH